MNSHRDDTGLYIVGGLVALGVFVGVLGWLPAKIIAFFSGQNSPSFSLIDSLKIFSHTSDPLSVFGVSGSPVAFWIVFALELLLVIACFTSVLAFFLRKRGLVDGDPYKNGRGLATVRDIKPLTAKAMVKTAAWVRPEAPKPVKVDDVAYLLGKAHRKNVYMSVEDSFILCAPARSGKTRGFIVPMLKQAPGCVVSTSTRTENLSATIRERAEHGPVAVFATSPDIALPNDVQVQRWSLTSGCNNPDTALRRALALTANSANGVKDGDFWEAMARKVIAPLLHAAELSEAGTRGLEKWARSAQAAEEAVTILSDHKGAAEGWASVLSAAIRGKDPKLLGNVWTQLDTSIVIPLMSPSLKASVTPVDGNGIDTAEFIKSGGTLYIVDDSAQAAGFIAALIEDFYYQARYLANSAPSGRLEPPMCFSLDEVVNIAKLPSLAHMMSAGGGSGITTMVALQSLSQAYEKWGTDYGNALWQAATSRVVLGGITDERMLESLSKLTGRRIVDKETVSYDNKYTVGLPRNVSMSEHEKPVLSVDEVREIPFGKALLLTRSIAPVLLSTQAGK